MSDNRGSWRHYNGVGIPCDPASYVDVCEGAHDVYIDVPAHQSFDRSVTHWRPSIDDANRKPARSLGERKAGGGEK